MVPDRTRAGSERNRAGPTNVAYAPFIAKAAERFSIPAEWIRAVMHVESRGNSRAVSPVGAMGLMQIMPATWADLSARYGLGADPFDPRASIHAGAAYLHLLWERYGSLAATLAAYNAGPGRVDAYVAGRRSLPAETAAYVDRVARRLSGSIERELSGQPASGSLAGRRAAIFVARSSGTSTGSRFALASASDLQPASPINAATPKQERPSGSLFVTVSVETRP